MYYADLGMDMGLFAKALLFARIADIAVTLLAGFAIEKIHLSIGSGKYRSWLFVCQFALLGGMALLFADFFGTPSARFAAVLAGSVLANAAMVFAANAQYGILPLMAGPSSKERNRLSISCYRLSCIGSALVLLAGASAVQWSSRNIGRPHNYFVMAAFFALFFFHGIAALRSSSKSCDAYVEGGYGLKQATLAEMALSVAANRRLLVYLLASTLACAGSLSTAGLSVFYWQTIVQNGYPDLFVSTNTAAGVSAAAFSLIGPLIGVRAGKKNAMAAGLAIAAISGVFTALFAAQHWWVFIGASILASFATSVYAGFGVNFALDCGEYYFWRTGKDGRMPAMSMSHIPMKAAAAIASLFVYALAAIGYEGSAGTIVDEAFIRSFMLLLGGAPAALYAAAALLVHFGYAITDEDAARYSAENVRRLSPPPLG
jgi:Na+/melibiose symporter-like transporter